MPADRVLIEIVTAANMAGVKEAKTGFFGLNAATAGLAIGLGALVLVGKSAIANTEAMDKSHLGLAQAVKATHGNLTALQAQFDSWATTNKRYVADQYNAESALANFVRTGLGAKLSMRALNDSLDISVIKGVSMTDAQLSLTQALAGNSKGLRFLGITTAQYNAIMKAHIPTAQKYNELLGLIEPKLKHARESLTPMEQSQYALNKDWQDMTTKIGPPLLTLFTGVADQGDRLVTALDTLGKDKGWNQGISDGLGIVQNEFLFFIGLIQTADYWLGKLAAWNGGAGAKPSKAPAASYAPGSQGRYGGAQAPAQVTINLHGAALVDGPALDKFANQVAQRLQYTAGT